LYFIVIGRGLSLDRFSDELENVSLDKLKRIIIIDETNEVYKYYSAFDLFTMTSISEALSLVLLEALGSERLCLVTEGIFHDSSFRDLVYTFAPKEVDNYVSEVKRIMSLGKEEREKLGEIARRKINDEYSLTKMLNEFMKIWLNN
jgi:glycosyltransferase involved in cell wall biosynthesis